MIIAKWQRDAHYGQSARAGGVRPLSSDATYQQQHHQHDHDEPKGPTRVVAPALAVRPGRKRTDQDQHQNDQQDRQHFPPPLDSPIHFLRDGTLAPERRASDKPIAIACLRLLTFRPERPLRSLPRFISCIARLTFLPLARPYLRLAIPKSCWLLRASRPPGQ